MIVEDLLITEQKQIADNIFMMKLTGNSVSHMDSPGQFIHLKVADGIDPLLRRPISICDVDAGSQELKIIYRTEGKGTKQLSEKKVSDTVNVLGPLGEGFPTDHMERGETALLVGGGVGVPPLYYLAKKLAAKGIDLQIILGFRSEKDVFLEEEFKKLGQVTVTTEDGSRGLKGYVTDGMAQLDVPYQTYYTCGPTPMLRAVQLSAKSEGYVSLEERMGCGVGACLACVCDVAEDHIGEGKKYRKACSDGPVFIAGEVII
ncbi:dihydroorotate dehydrogenase electron transfer subunit [Salipaludibacillus keqinensis]|uniref:Dihydroorotate dehydrogenase B (NAD(+)), electron transfer subunit n=1 Tax=Salipaludibacillus keqinensis TaxID=2045207 RepID=A0A323TUS7_9BACI|nr:dihydroorotate dehydrogenase electron transfer subunit [Salipaludibacillus keqinensis]PYZ93215.1 dihydroorotate dehydrogenase electron transfer subunit [Salipaludibacillus keqinensis]